VSNGARGLMELNIVKVEFLHGKFLTELRAGSWTWPEIQKHFGPWILDDGIVLPEEVAPTFRSAFLTTSFTDMITEFWPWPIQKYDFSDSCIVSSTHRAINRYGLRLSIEPDEYQKMLELRQEWQTLRDDHHNLVKTAKKSYSREEILAGAKYGQATARVESAAEQEKRGVLGIAVSDTKQASVRWENLSLYLFVHCLTRSVGRAG
jgi:hypothetical protein